MTKLLDWAVETVRRLPDNRQDEIAHDILRSSLATGTGEVIAPEHLRAVLDGLEQVHERQFATETEIAEAFRRFDR